MSYALGLRALEEGKEEQVVFVTKEVGRNIPRLVVTFSEPTTPIAVWYVWPAVGVGAVIVFLVGVLVARRRPGARPCATMRTWRAKRETRRKNGRPQTPLRWDDAGPGRGARPCAPALLSG